MDSSKFGQELLWWNTKVQTDNDGSVRKLGDGFHQCTLSLPGKYLLDENGKRYTHLDEEGKVIKDENNKL